MRGPAIPGILMLACNGLFGAASAEVVTQKDPDTSLLSWVWREQGISVELVQRLPDQTRAFFLGRGFGAEDADRVGRACVFQTIFRNDGTLPVAYDLDDWAVRYQGGQLPLQTREIWDREWLTKGVGQAARIAFRWSLLPTRQRFEPGDYNWGMTSFGLPPGESFDLGLVVHIDGARIAGEIPALVCAADR